MCFYRISSIMFLPQQLYCVFPLSSILFHPSTTKCFHTIRYKVFLPNQLHSVFSCVTTAPVLQCFPLNSVLFHPSTTKCFRPIRYKVFLSRQLHSIFQVFLLHQFYSIFTPIAPLCLSPHFYIVSSLNHKMFSPYQVQGVFSCVSTASILQCFYSISSIVFFLPVLFCFTHQLHGVFTPIAPVCFPLRSVLFHPSTTKCFHTIRYKVFLPNQLHSVFSCNSTAPVLQCFYSISSIVFFLPVLSCFTNQLHNFFYPISFIVFCTSSIL